MIANILLDLSAAEGRVVPQCPDVGRLAIGPLALLRILPARRTHPPCPNRVRFLSRFCSVLNRLAPQNGFVWFFSFSGWSIFRARRGGIDCIVPRRMLVDWGLRAQSFQFPGCFVDGFVVNAGSTHLR